MSQPSSTPRTPTDDEAFAERLWRWSIENGTADAPLHRNLGRLLESQQRDAEAEACYRTALELDSGHVEAQLSLGELLMKHQQNDEAEQCLRQLLQQSPAIAAAHCNLGLVLARASRHDEAEQSYRAAIALDETSVAAHTDLGLLLEAMQRNEEAELCHRRALELQPDVSEVHSNLGNLLARLGRFAEAERCHLKAFTLEPDSPAVLSNLGVLLVDCQRDADAEQCLRTALALRPGYPLASLNLGYLLLSQGRYAEGWVPHDARNDPDLPLHGKPPPLQSTVLWKGEPLSGRSILIWGEQGRGDQIQFSRYLVLLKAAGAAHVTLVCYAGLAPVFETLDAVDTVLGAQAIGREFVVESGALAEHDYWVFPMSLPRLLEPEAAMPHAKLPYLFALPERVRQWSVRMPARVDHRPLRVGLVWRGNPLHSNDNDRSLPALSMFAPLWSVAGVQFISLQPGVEAIELDAAAAGGAVLDLGNSLVDFADTAAVLAQIDLLISVDTATAHLAGAMARPCWLMLPFHRTDWRWQRDREDSPWYPGVMRIFRQSTRGDWGSAVEALRLALEDQAANGGR